MKKIFKITTLILLILSITLVAVSCGNDKEAADLDTVAVLEEIERITDKTEDENTAAAVNENDNSETELITESKTVTKVTTENNRPSTTKKSKKDTKESTTKKSSSKSTTKKNSTKSTTKKTTTTTKAETTTKHSHVWTVKEGEYHYEGYYRCNKCGYECTTEQEICSHEYDCKGNYSVHKNKVYDSPNEWKCTKCGYTEYRYDEGIGFISDDDVHRSSGN